MIEIQTEITEDIVVLKMSGMVSESDIDQCNEQLEPRLQDERPDHVLLDWRELAGWEPGAKSVGTWFGMRHWATVKRVAIVGDNRWDDETLRITDIFKAAAVRRFAPVDRQRALDWLVET